MSDKLLLELNLKSFVETESPGHVHIFLLRRFVVLLVEGDLESFKKSKNVSSTVVCCSLFSLYSGSFLNTASGYRGYMPVALNPILIIAHEFIFIVSINIRSNSVNICLFKELVDGCLTFQSRIFFQDLYKGLKNEKSRGCVSCVEFRGKNTNWCCFPGI